MIMHLKKNIAISETGFLFDPSTGDSYSLNPLGLEVLNLIKEGHDQEKISAFITSKYDVDDSAFERYYYDFVAMLKHHQIIDSNGEN